MSGSDLDPELIALEQSLTRLEPRGQLDRDAVLFRAGQAAGRGRHLWQATTALSTFAALFLGWLLWNRPTPEPERIIQTIIVERPVLPPVEPPLPPRTTPEPRILADSGTADYLRRRKEVLRWGAEMLPQAPPLDTTGDPLTPGSAPRLDPDGIDIKKILKISSFFNGDDT